MNIRTQLLGIAALTMMASSAAYAEVHVYVNPFGWGAPPPVVYASPRYYGPPPVVYYGRGHWGDHREGRGYDRDRGRSDHHDRDGGRR
jgi:hypothetical protein